MFADRGYSSNGLKHLREKATTAASLTRVRVVVDRTMPTALQISTKLKTSRTDTGNLISVGAFILCQKHLEQAFFYVIFFTHIHLSRFLSSMVNKKVKVKAVYSS